MRIGSHGWYHTLSQVEKGERQGSMVRLPHVHMLKLCSHHIDKNTGIIRCEPGDRLANFLCDNEDVTLYIVTFFSRKDDNLRNSSKERLLAMAEEMNLLRESGNMYRNEKYFGVKVD